MAAIDSGGSSTVALPWLILTSVKGCDRITSGCSERIGGLSIRPGDQFCRVKRYDRAVLDRNLHDGRFVRAAVGQKDVELALVQDGAGIDELSQAVGPTLEGWSLHDWPQGDARAPPGIHLEWIEDRLDQQLVPTRHQRRDHVDDLRQVGDFQDIGVANEAVEKTRYDEPDVAGQPALVILVTTMLALVQGVDGGRGAPTRDRQGVSYVQDPGGFSFTSREILIRQDQKDTRRP